MNNRKKIGITITEGRVMRDLFNNKFLDYVINLGYDIVILSPAANYDEFLNEYQSKNIDIIWFPKLNFSKFNKILLRIRSYIKSKNISSLFKKWMLIEKILWRPDKKISKIIISHNISLFVITNPMFSRELEINNTAQSMGKKTIGVIRSWDNFWRGLDVKVDFLAVWGPINKLEAKNLWLYDDDFVEEIGPTPMDRYFLKDTIWSKETFLNHFNFRNGKPIITIATLGSLTFGLDETYLIDLIIDSINTGRISKDTQLILRLHPATKLEYFLKFNQIENVVISYIDKYIPTLGWTMNNEDVDIMANILYHSDVIISPGSTVTIEAAIFDTPILFPIFNPRQQKLLDEFYKINYWDKHFKKLIDNDLIILQDTPAKLIDGINNYLEHPESHKSERSKIVEDYIKYTDGSSTKRLVNLISKVLDNNYK
jgi:hypothetical protein